MNLETWKQRARRLSAQTYALYLAYRHPRTPWYAKVFAALIVGYVFSPLDPIPDFIPGVGLLDEMVVVPVGMLIAAKRIPLLRASVKEKGSLLPFPDTSSAISRYPGIRSKRSSRAPSPRTAWNVSSGSFVFRELRADLVPAKALRNVLDLLTIGRLYKFTLPLVRR